MIDYDNDSDGSDSDFEIEEDNFEFEVENLMSEAEESWDCFKNSVDTCSQKAAITDTTAINKQIEAAISLFRQVESSAETATENHVYRYYVQAIVRLVQLSFYQSEILSKKVLDESVARQCMTQVDKNAPLWVEYLNIFLPLYRKNEASYRDYLCELKDTHPELNNAIWQELDTRIGPLPKDCWMNILLYCMPRSALSVMLVSKHYHHLVNSVEHYQSSFWACSWTGYTRDIPLPIAHGDDELHFWKQRYRYAFAPDLLFVLGTHSTQFHVWNPLNGKTIYHSIKHRFGEHFLAFQQMKMYERESMYCAIAENSIGLYSGSELLSIYRLHDVLTSVVWCRNLRNFIFLVTQRSLLVFYHYPQSAQLRLLHSRDFDDNILGAVGYRISEDKKAVEFFIVSRYLYLFQVKFDTRNMGLTFTQVVAGGYRRTGIGEASEYDQISELSEELWVAARCTYSREIECINLLEKIVVRTFVECVAMGSHLKDPLIYFTTQGIDNRLHTFPKPTNYSYFTQPVKTPLTMNRVHGSIGSIRHRGDYILCTSWDNCIYVISSSTHQIVSAKARDRDE